MRTYFKRKCRTVYEFSGGVLYNGNTKEVDEDERD